MMENVNNFLTEIIDEDIANGLSERIHTRFPPEPNGYLHIGSAKAIFINWSIAKKYNGLFNLRYDDTNPVKEDTEYVDSIWEDIKWLTGEEPSGGVFYGSDYFETCFELRRAAHQGRQGVCGRSDAGGNARVPRLSDRSRASRARTATVRSRRTSSCSRICATASSPTAPRRCAPRSTWPART